MPVIDQVLLTSLRATGVGPQATCLPLSSSTKPMARLVSEKSNVQPVTSARLPCTVTESSQPIGDSDTWNDRAADPALAARGRG